MSNHKLKNRIKKIKRGFLIWRLLILLLVNLWLDNLIFKIFRTNRDKKNSIQIKRAKWFTNQLIELGSAFIKIGQLLSCLLYTSPSPRDRTRSRMPSSA